MFAKHFVSFLVWVLFFIGFVSFSVGGYVCHWVCLSVGSYVCQWVCLSVGSYVCQWVCLSVGSYVCYWVCVFVGWYVIMPCNSREGASVGIFNYRF